MVINQIESCPAQEQLCRESERLGRFSKLIMYETISLVMGQPEHFRSDNGCRMVIYGRGINHLNLSMETVSAHHTLTRRHVMRLMRKKALAMAGTVRAIMCARRRRSPGDKRRPKQGHQKI
ncbi:hypothetical protein [Sneathiella limimaris]|uniref:hypothetical protein n=1 Tax=Sneathiella limimaris TaxID=1964213 RepID=UPI0019D305AF|nr:hypothetical protein [Sneathiella limimaris]